MLRSDKTVLAVIDVQTRLVEVMHAKDAFLLNVERLIRGARALGLPILWTEQNPDRMGETHPAVRDLLRPQNPIPKMTFSCWREPAFAAALAATNRSHALLAGIEAHVCVCQTALDLRANGYAVDVAADACSSRTETNRRIGLERMRGRGVEVSGVETALFELMESCRHPAFREILKVVK